MPPPLVRIASRFPGGSTRPSVSAQSNSSRRSETRRTPGAAERRVVDGVRAGERAGMGGGRLRALRHAAGLHHDDRLHARRGTRGRHELARVLDGFDVEQNRTGLVIHREIVEQIGNIDIDLVADRDDAGEADAALRGPIDHAGRDRARLRNQREISAPGMCAAKLALRLTPGIMMPRQFGPISRMPYLRAAAIAASCRDPGP